MKSAVRIALILVALIAYPWLSATALAQDGRLQLPNFDHLSKIAAEAVDITLDESLLKLASAFMDKSDEADLRKLLAEVRGIYVRSYEFDKDGAYSPADVDAVRSQLSRAGWARMVNVKSIRDASHAEVYVFTDKGAPGGIAIVSAEPRELTIVNIVGRIDLSQLRQLEGSFGIPKVQGDPAAKKD